MKFLFLAYLFLLTNFANAQNISSEVNATPALLKLITVEAVKAEDLQDSLHFSARVELDQQHVAKIGSTVTGRISEISAKLGDDVKKGQRLAILNSTELSQAQSDYLKASSQVNLRRIAVERAKRLVESDVIASAELQEREGVLNEAEVDLRAATDRLRVLGMSEADLKRLEKQRTIHSYSPVTASIDGVVIERNVTQGQVVQPADQLYTIANLSTVWIVADVPEQDALWVKQGDQVEAEIPALDNKVVKGNLIYVSDIVNSKTRTVMVRMGLSNPQRLFKPQMLVTLKVKKSKIKHLAIPSQAVVRDEDKDYVFVQTGQTTFQLRAVKLGEEENGMRLLIGNEIKEGEHIVTKGSFHLNNERLRSTLE